MIIAVVSLIQHRGGFNFCINFLSFLLCGAKRMKEQGVREVISFIVLGEISTPMFLN